MEFTLAHSTTIRPGLVERTTTLALIMILAFLSNLILLVTICQSSSLRQIHSNKYILNISIVNLLTCILGMPMVLGYSVTSQWDYGDVMCRVFAHFLYTMSIAMCLSILVMNIDRVIAIYDPDKYHTRINSVKTVLLIVTLWIVAILFPLPLSLGVEPTRPFGNRYICSIDAGASINYLLSLYFICFAFPPVINVLCFIYISREALSEKEAESLGVAARPTSTSRLWPEVQTAGVVFIIFLLWILTELPYTILTSVEQYIHSSDVGGEFLFSADLDTAFMWLKFSDCCIFPFIIFKFRKNIWIKFKDLIFCRKSNSVVDASPRPEKNKNKAKPSLVKPDTPKFEASFPIPTIKATKDGLHVQDNAADADEEIFYANLDLTGKSEDFDRMGSTVATNNQHGDVEIARDEGDQTSDYETDPYSQSDPISVRSVTTIPLTSHLRSHSTATSDSKEFRTKANSVSHDSGNGSASSSVKKKRRKKRTVANYCIEDEPPPVSDSDHTHSFQAAELNAEQEISSPTSLSRKPLKNKNRIGNASMEAETNVDVTSVTDPNTNLDAEGSRVVRKKKKKKRKNKDITDAQTNTSQVITLELLERKIPPPRLDPISSSINTIATPPLRSKVTREHDVNALPPSGVSQAAMRKRQSEEPSALDEEYLTNQNRKKKSSSRPRHKSGDSDRPLMSSNASSELQAVVNTTYLESHI